MSMHLQLLATGFFGISQADGLGPYAREIYAALGRFWQVADWVLTGTYRRNIARERAREVTDLAIELRRHVFGVQEARKLAKVIVADRRLHSAMWTALLAGAR